MKTIKEALEAGHTLKLKAGLLDHGTQLFHTVTGFNHKLGGVELTGDERYFYTKGVTYLWWISEIEVLRLNGIDTAS